jgi:hypothetical protein
MEIKCEPNKLAGLTDEQIKTIMDELFGREDKDQLQELIANGIISYDQTFKMLILRTPIFLKRNSLIYPVETQTFLTAARIAAKKYEREINEAILHTENQTGGSERMLAQNLGLLTRDSKTYYYFESACQIGDLHSTRQYSDTISWKISAVATNTAIAFAKKKYEDIAFLVDLFQEP